ncbi:hypothetical protein F442_15323 [Phytophthora nicotianae P10297]|uniref:RxLR effector protein n=1 Tax=Phytophthora nicotianae P10297 TaxID=1317064 RepID=W2YPS5_PHYNI|nr:hypothetical protein F442_15323 [Phytophthora nicotianae P10297]
MEASNEGRSDGEHTTENSIARSLRRLDTSGDEEERDLFGIFAKNNLKKMMKSESFKHTMFGNWDGFTVGHIRTKLKDKYPELLLDYLNVYKKGGDEVVRHAKNPNKVKFANKPTIRFYSTES